MGKNPSGARLRHQNESSSNGRKQAKKEAQRKLVQTLNRKNESPTTPIATSTSLLYPAGDTAFKALLSARFCAAIWSYVTDCDETYNYWEPMHYLIFGKGLQTWEYSPEYGLRSYTYLMLHAAPAFLYHKLLQPNPLLIFYLIRCALGFLCALSEVYFYKAVCREFGDNVGRLCLAFQLFAAGMFFSSTAFLPASFTMYTTAAAFTAWLGRKYALAVFLTAVGTLLGWPFVAALGIPIALDMLIRKKLFVDFFKWSGISLFVIAVPMILIDSSFYGKLVIAPWNIVKYNIFGGGVNYFGSEPFSFYFINGFLNFNFVWVFALLCPIFLFLQYLFIPVKNKLTATLPHYMSVSPLFIWLGVFVFQAHKEERFLYPVYPLICLCGAITVDVIQKLAYRVWCLFKTVPPGTHYLDFSLFIMVGTVFVTSVIAVSRIFALYTSYHAPLDLLMELNRFQLGGKRVASNAVVNVCMGKEWHRYPSSFFLLDTNWNVRFVRSEFKGILPFPYAEGENATAVIHGHFNDRNEEEPSVYFDINRCHFMLDLDVGKETELEPIYANNRDRWKVLKSIPFLDAERSHRFFRAFYVPYLSGKYVTYGNYTLLQSVTRPKKTMK